MKKLTKAFLSLTATCCFAFSGCALGEARGIASIQKTATNGLVDTYTVYYTDGTTSVFEITNGQNGVDGQNGKDGVDGQNGVDGKNGIDGKNGVDGKNGTDGKNGVDGKNGKDGVDGENLRIEDVYEKYKEEYGEISYADFLSLYMTVENNDYTVIGNCLLTSAKVYSEFEETVSGGWWGSSTTKTAISTGSSVIYQIDQDYTYFITNYHVVYNANGISKISDNIHCYLYGSEGGITKVSSGVYDYGDYAIECEYIGGSITYDLALLKARTSDVMAINDKVQEVEFASDYHVGQTAVAIGNPNDEGISVTKGVVSVDNEYITLDIDGTIREYRSIRMDTALYGGNSGGGLFNEKGELIGINNAGKTEEENINYAIPLPIVKGVVQNIMHYHNDNDNQTNGVYKTTLGVTVTSEKSRYVFDETLGFGKIVEDIVISAVTSGSIVETMGLTIGDKLVSMEIDGTRYALNRNFDVADGILLLTVGSNFSFVYERSGQEYTTQAHTIISSEISLVA